MAFLNEEIPKMEAAVSRSDRAYFEGALQRSAGLLEQWGLRTNPIELERHPMCADAVIDFLIVGLCKLSDPQSICDPTTFFPRFEKELAICRAEAAGSS